ncbi:MAG: MFS transporter [Planctomycetota bacterium]|nr:MFS transporter [Planctomycetota bacterium]
MTLWVLWATYGSFYLCRTNLSAALPGIEDEFGFSKTDMASVLISLKIAYGIGQLVNGQLAERISPRIMLATGMLASIALNLVFGAGASIWFFSFVWAMNGYSQALGWTPTMRVAANWMPVAIRGRSIGIIGTGYMVGASLSYVLSGWAVDEFGWRGGLYVPSAVLFVACLHMLLLLRVAPDTGAESAAARAEGSQRPFRETLRLTLTNGDLWLLAVALGLLNACRYGYLDWGIFLIKEVQGESVGKSAIKFAILPAGGILGALGAGWVTDRLFGGRRAPVICGMLVALALLTILFKTAVEAGNLATVSVLFAIGVTIYGPQVLLVGTAPTDMARAGAVASAVGFVNFMGYMGASAGDWFTARVADSERGWDGVYWLWASWALVAAACVAVLWNRRAVKESIE